jgi:hypothetical protein
LTNFVNRDEKLGVMPDDENNLRRAEEQAAEARRLVLQQKGLITRLRAAGIDTANAERILKVLERNLKTFEHLGEFPFLDVRDDASGIDSYVGCADDAASVVAVLTSGRATSAYTRSASIWSCATACHL